MARHTPGRHSCIACGHGASRAILCLMSLLGLATLPRLWALQSHTYIYRKDILQEYLLVRAAISGGSPYRNLPELAIEFLGVKDTQILPHPTPHPPSIIPLVLWMAPLTYETSALVWLILELCFLVACGYLAARRLVLRPEVGWGLVIAVAMVGWYPVYLELVYGQLMVFITLLLFVALELMNERRHLAAGVVIGIAVAAKLFAWPLWLLLALRKEWRTLSASVLCFLVLTAIGTLAIGLDDASYYYLDVSQTISKLYRACTYNYSLSTVGWRLFSEARCETIIGVTALPAVHNKLLAQTTAWAIPGAVLLLFAYACHQIQSREVQFSLMVGVSVLVSPVAWAHYLTLAVIPLIVALSILQRKNNWSSRRLGLWLAVAFGLTYVPEHSVSAFIGGFGTQIGVRHVGETLVSFPIGLVTLYPLAALLGILLLLWLLSRADRVPASDRAGHAGNAYNPSRAPLG